MNEPTLPIVNWPEESGSYKVIQLLDKVGQQPYLRFDDTSGYSPDGHMFTLYGFAEEIGTKLVEAIGNPLKKILPEDCGYELIGAGECELNLEGKIASFKGGSGTYGLFIDENHLKKIKEKAPSWRIIYGSEL